MGMTCLSGSAKDVVMVLARHVSIYLRHGLHLGDLVKLYEAESSARKDVEKAEKTDLAAKQAFSKQSKYLVFNLLQLIHLIFVVYSNM